MENAGFCDSYSTHKIFYPGLISVVETPAPERFKVFSTCVFSRPLTVAARRRARASGF
jgi:hypothetical protein